MFLVTRLLALLLGLLLVAGPLSALSLPDPPVAPLTLNQSVKNWNAELAEAGKSLAKPESLSDDELEALRSELNQLILDVREATQRSQPELNQTRDELGTLGEPPAQGAPVEAPEIASHRKAIAAKLAGLEGAQKESELSLAQADRLLAKLAGVRRGRFTEKLLAQVASPLSGQVWRRAVPEVAGYWDLARQGFDDWLPGEDHAKQRGLMVRNLLFALLAAVGLIWPWWRGLSRLLARHLHTPSPSHGERLRFALLNGFTQTIVPTALALSLYLALVSSGLLPESAQELASTSLLALIALFFVAAFCRAALSPAAPAWRLVKLGDHAAGLISRVVPLIALVFAVDKLLDAVSNQIDASLELTILHKCAIALLVSGLLMLLLRRAVWVKGDGREGLPQGSWSGARFFLLLLVLAIPVSALLGYVALSTILANHFVLTVGLILCVLLALQISAETVEHTLAADSAFGLPIRKSFGLSDDGSAMLAFWLSEIFGLLILVLGGVALLMLWGNGREDVSAWLNALLFGFKIGKFTLSFVDILTACFWFGLLLVLTRLLQKGLEKRIFPRTRLDIGLRNSIRSTVGYLGFTLAAVVAVAQIGIDLSSLAIIAGALSVGIGFGLQNIVNNFVSGLILLIERPIKVGDWIIIGEHQGYVKKISVRATEITTFDQASVFIPNSNLIASPVINRTHADKIGRIVLPIGLAHGCDPRKARELLLQIALEHPLVCGKPASYCILKGFSEAAMPMELVVFIADVDKTLSVTSDLCFEIVAVFRREGIQLVQREQETHLALDPAQLERLLDAWTKRPQL